MNEHKASQPSYVLWLIRKHNGMTRAELMEHFTLELDCPTERTVLDVSLNMLEDAGFIQDEEVEGVMKIRATSLMSKVQTTLGLNFSELAKHQPQSSMLISPTFGLPSNTKFTFDVFVLMPFTPELQPVYQDHIKNVARELGMSVARADDFFTTQSVMEEIWAAIVNSKIMIADCTGKNPNVFYEIGVAHSIGKPVVLIAQNPEDVPFDLRHRRYIRYEYTPRGIKDFEDRLRKTLIEANASV
jgi:hypothetical protein